MKRIFITLFIIVMLCTDSRALAIPYIFTGSGNWSDASNWDTINGNPPNPLPSGDYININGTGPAILDIDYTILYNTSIIGIAPSKTLIINSGITMTLNCQLSNSGTLINNGTISVISNVISNLYVLTVLTNNGILTCGLVSQGTVTNNGTLNINIIVSPGNSGILYNVGTLNININSRLENSGTLNNTGILNNSGTFLQAPTGNLINNNIINNNTGGSMSSSGTLNNNDTMNNNSGASFTNNSSVSTFNNNGILNNNGTFINNMGTLNNGGVFVNNNTLNSNGVFNIVSPLGELILNTTPAVFPGGTFNWDAGGTVTIGPNGTMTLSSPLTVGVARTFVVDVGGVLTNNSTLTNNGTVTKNGTLNNTGIFNNNSGADLILNTNPTTFPGGTFNWNIGSTVTIGQNGVMTITGPFEFLPGRFFVVLPGGSFILN